MLTSIPFEYAGDGFVIRMYRPEDAVMLQDSLNSSYDSLVEFLPWAVQEQSLLKTKEFIEGAIADYHRKVNFIHGIFSSDGKKLIGGTGFHPHGRGLGGGWAEIGMWIRQDEQGQGLAKKVLRAMKDWAFAEWPWRRLEWRCDELNQASAKVAEAEGFHCEARLVCESKDHFGRWRNTLIFTMLKYHPDDPSQGFHCRDISIDDADALGSIHADTWQDTYTGLMPEENLYFRSPKQSRDFWYEALEKNKVSGDLIGVFSSAGKLLGMVCCGAIRKDFPNHSGEVYALNVPRIYQGHGLGKAMLQEAFSRLHEAGHQHVLLWCLTCNEKSLGFYDHMGGRRLGEQMIDDLEHTGFAWDLVDFLNLS